MIFCILTHVVHSKNEKGYFAYSPYINEMNIWLKYVDKVIIVAPLESFNQTDIHNHYLHSNIEFIPIAKFNLKSVKGILNSIIKIPNIAYTIFKAMNVSNHIHLRCPGNIGLIASVVQVFFPSKNKTAKYAGNWDPKAKQPLSYKLQKALLSNTFLTKKMQVLVYGEWKNQTKNVKPFFTATYKESEKTETLPKDFSNIINFIFVGSLTVGKRPLYALKLIELLSKENKVSLSIYGEGEQKNTIENYVKLNNLSNIVSLKGNTTRENLIEVYKKSHFLLLPSKSEGWPKVVAEAMFWGCLPIATPVSCISNMLNKSERGLLLTLNSDEDLCNSINLIKNELDYTKKVNNAINWSRNYTTDKFEFEIKKLLR